MGDRIEEKLRETLYCMERPVEVLRASFKTAEDLDSKLTSLMEDRTGLLMDLREAKVTPTQAESRCMIEDASSDLQEKYCLATRCISLVILTGDTTARISRMKSLSGDK